MELKEEAVLLTLLVIHVRFFFLLIKYFFYLFSVNLKRFLVRNTIFIKLNQIIINDKLLFLIFNIVIPLNLEIQIKLKYDLYKLLRVESRH